jgi:hypothetical protein
VEEVEVVANRNEFDFKYGCKSHREEVIPPWLIRRLVRRQSPILRARARLK